MRERHLPFRARCLRIAAAVLLVPVLSLGTACSTNPATGGNSFTAFMSPTQEREVGAEEHEKVMAQFGGAYDDLELAAYVNSIGQLLAQTSEMPDLKWTFTVLNSDVTNAFALPGGYVYVTRGLVALAESEAELAAVIGHEIGHVTARHTAQRYSQSVLAGLGAVAAGILLGGPAADLASGAAQLYLAQYSQSQENEADTLGIRYIGRIGFQPEAMSTFLAKLEAEKGLMARIQGQDQGEGGGSYLSTHPPTPQRVAKTAGEARAVTVPDPIVARDVFLGKIDGMLYGDDPEQGMVKGREFLHPQLGFAFTAPPGYALVNSPSAVIGFGPDDARMVFDRATRPVSGSMVSYVRDVWGQQVQIRDVEAIRINGMDAATGRVEANTQAGRVDLRAVAIRYDATTVYRFLFVTPVARLGTTQTELQRTTYSFRKLQPGEAANIRPYRIAIHTVRSGETVQSLAARMPHAELKLERFLVLNGLSQGDALRPGDKVKLVTE